MADKQQQYFNSKFPIICAGMNKVSTVALALAVKQAGGYPSLVAFNHIPINPDTDITTGDYHGLGEAMQEYKNLAGDSDYILGVSSGLLLHHKDVLDLIYMYKPAYIELFDQFGFHHDEFFNIIKSFQAVGIKVIAKILYPDKFLKYGMVCQAVDGVIVKGTKAAGRVSHEEVDLISTVKKLRAYRNDWVIIAQGGIHDSAGIKELLDAGANAVSMGTIFALSQESSVSAVTKQKMLEASYSDTVKIGTANQNGLLFTNTENDVENNTIGLTAGVRTGVAGHVFAGQAIDYISEIKPVSQIIAELTVGL